MTEKQGRRRDEETEEEEVKRNAGHKGSKVSSSVNYDTVLSCRPTQ
jgi:hypothetical protein